MSARPDKPSPLAARKVLPMKPYDVDGIEVVADLADLRWDRFFEGRRSERHIGSTVIENSGAWSTVLVAVRDVRSDRPCPVRYVLARYRREGGAWRLRNHFRLPRRTLEALAERAPVFIAECESEKSKCGSSSSTGSSPS